MVEGEPISRVTSALFEMPGWIAATAEVSGRLPRTSCGQVQAASSSVKAPAARRREAPGIPARQWVDMCSSPLIASQSLPPQAASVNRGRLAPRAEISANRKRRCRGDAGCSPAPGPVETAPETRPLEEPHAPVRPLAREARCPRRLPRLGGAGAGTRLLCTVGRARYARRPVRNDRVAYVPRPPPPAGRAGGAALDRKSVV